MEQKVGRNDPCPCGSGKKYKKCCEERLKHKKFNAEWLSAPKLETVPTDKAQKISTGFFSRVVTPIASKPHPSPDEGKHPDLPM